MAPLSDYVLNKIFQELPNKEEYFSKADARVYIDVRGSKGYTGKLGKLREATAI